MLQDYTGSVFVPAFWSLGAEEKFYLLAPAARFLRARPVSGWQACGLGALWLLPVAARVPRPRRLPAGLVSGLFPRAIAARFTSPASRWSSDLRSRGCR